MLRSVILTFAMLMVPILQFAQNSPESLFRKYEKIEGTVPQSIRVTGQEYVIPVRNQSEMDGMNDAIKRAIKSGRKNIVVRVTKGTYYFKNLSVYLYDIKDPSLSIRIEGNGATLVAGGVDYVNRSPYNDDLRTGATYLDENLQSWDLRSDVAQGRELVEVLDAKKKTCRIRTGLPDQSSEGMWIEIPEWFKVGRYPVTQVKGGYVYFTATDLEYSTRWKGYNVNNDYYVSKLMPRYALYNVKSKERFYVAGKRVSLPGEVKRLHECQAYHFAVLYRMQLKSFSVSDLSFYGGTDKGELMFFRNVEAEQLLVENNRFRFARNLLVRCDFSNNLVFRGNDVRDCYSACVRSNNGSKGTVICENVFYNVGMNLSSTACVACYGEGFHVYENQFVNFSNMAISAGVNYKNGKKYPLNGVIEYNEAWYEPAYFQEAWKYSLSDSGCFYFSTIHDQTIVRYNYIHDYTGVDSNRGIYCDDGTQNTIIYGNVIKNVPKSYAIFLRRSNVDKYVPRSNDGNVIMYNVIWGNYMFAGRKDGNNVKGQNYILKGKGQKDPDNTFSDLKVSAADVMYIASENENGTISVPADAARKLKQSPAYQGINRWLK